MQRTLVLTISLGLATATFYALAFAQENASQAASKTSRETGKLAIVPLVTVRPGETKELLLSTWCTVGITRGGGFGLTEMRDGKPAGGGHDVKSYRQHGVTISVPNFEEGTSFANSPQYAALKARNVQAFQVTIAASKDAQPGVLDMHLVDSTCSGHCQTDFRVLVVAP